MQDRTFNWSDLSKPSGEVHILLIWIRPGARLFVTTLEYTYYKPRTERNALFKFGVGLWNGIQAAVVSIPKEDVELARKVAAELGMSLTQADDDMLPAIYYLSGNYDRADEAERIEAVWKADEVERKAYVMENIQVSRATRKFLDHWTKVLKLPRLKFRLEATNEFVLDTLVVYCDSQACGFITICQDGPGSQPYAGGIYVVPEARRWGIGTVLFHMGINYCRHFNLGRLRVLCGSTALHNVLDKLPSGRDKYLEITEIADHRYDADMKGESPHTIPIEVKLES